MAAASRPPHRIARPRHPSAIAVTVWVFAVIEAVAIGYLLWTY